MEIIVLPKYKGKSTALVKMAAEQMGDGAYIMCPTRRDARRLVKIAGGLSLRIHFPLTPMDRCDRFGPGVKFLLIDDLDRILRELWGRPIHAVTFTGEG